MAAEARQYRYANAVYGSVAYDYNSTAAPDVLTPEREAAPPLEVPREVPRERTRQRTKVQTTFGVPLFAIIGGLAVAAMVVCMLMGYVQLTRLSAEKAALERELYALTEQNDRLRISYESTFNMNEVERYAVNVLGMTKLADKDTTVFKLDKSDRAEILCEEDIDEGILGAISRFLDSVSEYFS